MDKSNRNPMPIQPAELRTKNFDEVAVGYDDKTAQAEANRCLNCKSAPCIKGCPVGINIPGFIGEIKNGNLDGAAKILQSDNNLAAICGRVCPQERQCENVCVRREKLGGAVGIGNLERYTADYALSQNKPPQIAESKEKSVAVVGSGPAGLTAAAELATLGVKVVIYEALHKAGGVLVYGIPEFRLPKATVQKEIDRVVALGVEIRLNEVVGKTVFIDELLNEFDAVFIGSGAGLPMFLHIAGENLCGVYSANEYLTRVNLMKAYKEDSATPILRGKKVVVVGAGNVAMDSARTAIRLGGKCHLVYRRSREEMPARAAEIAHAEDEGVEFELLTNPIEILGENGQVRGIRCIRMELGEVDASGRRSPIPILGSEFEIECDQVIVALGTTPNPLIKKSFMQLDTTKKGTICYDEDTFQTSVDRVYAGGDAITGAATVILAMGAGKKAAKAIYERIMKD
ncbi:MAG TPA: NADPH-dependent glutamate synthase [Clostridia bacterium]|nr:NADPH-dependent glutamate synthase [Clostridia bacterium]